MRQVWLAVLATALLGGCASVMEGPTQEITINTTPAGAACALTRGGQPLALIAATPGSVTIVKSPLDIQVVCELAGYQAMTTVDESGTAAAVFGNILVGGVMGIQADQSSGAAYKYDSPLNLTLLRLPDGAPPASQPVLAAAVFPPPPPPPPPPMPLSVAPPPTPVVASVVPASPDPAMPPAPPMAAPVMPVITPHPAPNGAMSPAAVPVEIRRAENAAERYRVLRQLVADGLVPQDRYAEWARQNEGAFLLVTASPAFAASGNKPPAYAGAAEFLRTIAAEKNLKVAEAEHQALFRALMPMEGAHAPPQKPPVDFDGLRSWEAFLDRLRDEGVLAAEAVEAEKTAINDTRITAGMAPMPVYSALAGVSVQ